MSAESVNAAADALVAQGQTVTLRSLRTALGGGSFTSIAPLLRAWDQRRQLALEPSRTMTVPVLQALEQAAPAIWAVALEQATQVLQGQIELRDQRIAQQVEHDTEMLAITQGLERELEREREQRQLALAEGARLDGEISKLTAAHQQLSETNAELSSQLRLLEERRATSEHERAQLRASLDQERELRTDRDRQLDLAGAQAQHLRADILRLSQELEQERQQHQSQLLEQRARSARLEDQVRQSGEAVTATRAELATAHDALRHQGSRIQALIAEVDELQAVARQSQLREQQALAQEREAREQHHHLSRQYAEMARGMGERLDAIQLAMARPVAEEAPAQPPASGPVEPASQLRPVSHPPQP